MPSGDGNRKLSEAQWREVARIYQAPNPDGTWTGVPTLARRFGVANFAVQHHLRRLGVKTRNARESHSGGKRCKPIVNLPHGEPPTCACGCGRYTEWNRNKNRWRACLLGHRTGGERHWSWRGGHHRGYPPDWADIARRIRKRDGYTCRSCGLEQRRPSLHVHHLDWNGANCDPENLVTLCGTCHSRHHLHGVPLTLPLAI